MNALLAQNRFQEIEAVVACEGLEEMRPVGCGELDIKKQMKYELTTVVRCNAGLSIGNEVLIGCDELVVVIVTDDRSVEIKVLVTSHAVADEEN